MSTPVGGEWNGAGGTIRAASLFVEAGSKINADSQGYTGGYKTDGNGPGGGGAAYGGSGGIAVYYTDSISWPTGNVSVAGGTQGGGAYVGLPGTVVIKNVAPGWWHQGEATAAAFTTAFTRHGAEVLATSATSEAGGSDVSAPGP